MKFYYNLIAELRQSHRLSRKTIPEKDKAAFITKAKEYSDWKIHNMIRQKKLDELADLTESNAMEALSVLPSYLIIEGTVGMNPSLDEENHEIFTHLERKRKNKISEEEREKILDINFTEKPIDYDCKFLRPELLYVDQYLSMIPDDMFALKMHEIKFSGILEESLEYSQKTYIVPEEGEQNAFEQLNKK